MPVRRWVVAPGDKELSRKISAQFGIPHFAAHLLVSRGITEPCDIVSMLTPLEQPLSDPFELIDMDKAVERINRALDRHESMAVYGDYDVDGVTATSLLYTYLAGRDANVTYMLPSRDEDGYGLHTQQIDRLAQAGVKLIITVDNGISANVEVDYANSLGIDVVVTDHHQPPEQLPRACAVVDAHRADCPSRFKEFAGVGIAFKLVCALDGDSERIAARYSDFVALGTVADVVPLTGENRSLVMRGLMLMRDESRLGISMLMRVSGVNVRRVNSTNISFVLSPRLNSAGRTGKPERAVRLMISEDMTECRDLATELQNENVQRHNCERDIAVQAWNLLEKDESILYDRVVVLCGEGWHHGVIGIFAARMCESLGKPCIILSTDGETAKGSGRSLGEFSLFDAFTACSEHLIAYGGHKLAAGLTLSHDKIDDFRRAINRYAASLESMPVPEISVDCVLPAYALNLRLMRNAELLEPFGSCNPSPVIGIKGATIRKIYPVGGGQHQRLVLEQDGYELTAMYFRISKEMFAYRIGDKVDCVLAISINEYRDCESLSCVVNDIRLSDTDLERLIKCRWLLDALLRGEDISPEERDMMLPTRDEAADVYRYLHPMGYNGAIDVLATRLERRGIPYGHTLAALEAMSSSGAVNMRFHGGMYTIHINQNAQKSDLFETKIMKRLAACE